MKVLLVDDEALARLRLRSLLAALATPQTEVVGEAASVEEALALQQATPADVALLDIRLPGPGSNAGLRLAAQLQRLPQPPAVIFVTAHAEHALAAFDLEAVDYLTKPVRRERLQAALQRVQLRLRPAGEPAAEGPLLVVSDRGRVLRLPLAEVLYCRAEQKYVTLRTAAHSHLVDDALAELELRLHELGGDFIRVHRNALVARRAIRELELRKGGEEGEGWAVRVAPLDEWLLVSRRQVGAVRSALAGDGGPG